MMISRRLIRIKIVQVLYAYFTNEGSTIDVSDKELTFSIKKAYDLYHYLILLVVKVADYAAERAEIASNKILPSFEDLHPNVRFIENKVIAQLRNSKQFQDYISQNKISWHEYPELIKKLYQKVTESSYFQDYMESEKIGYDIDKKLVIDILSKELEGWDFLYQLLEEQSVYWNDDIEFVVSMIIKTLERFKESNPSPSLMPLYKNEDDREFSKSLLRKTILKLPEYRKLIEKYTQNWEVERIASMDILIMAIALSEILEFPSIPIKVTLNEYIEIAKFYSTHKSNEFVNGILDKI
ncbi:MAG TPA: transcription antitermination factor NusB, partial [Bacteroidales bacterium]